MRAQRECPKRDFAQLKAIRFGHFMGAMHLFCAVFIWLIRLACTSTFHLKRLHS